tara:strand:- start:218 stop:421 length:204 start_codon:yes stop_codon:yes gene_type:complete
MYFVDIIKQADDATLVATLENANDIVVRTAYKIALDEATKQERIDHATAVMVRRTCEAELSKRVGNA